MGESNIFILSDNINVIQSSGILTLDSVIIKCNNEENECIPSQNGINLWPTINITNGQFRAISITFKNGDIVFKQSICNSLCYIISQSDDSFSLLFRQVCIIKSNNSNIIHLICQIEVICSNTDENINNNNYASLMSIVISNSTENKRVSDVGIANQIVIDPLNSTRLSIYPNGDLMFTIYVVDRYGNVLSHKDYTVQSFLFNFVY